MPEPFQPPRMEVYRRFRFRHAGYVRRRKEVSMYIGAGALVIILIIVILILIL